MFPTVEPSDIWLCAATNIWESSERVLVVGSGLCLSMSRPWVVDMACELYPAIDRDSSIVGIRPYVAKKLMAISQWVVALVEKSRACMTSL